MTVQSRVLLAVVALAALFSVAPLRGAGAPPREPLANFPSTTVSIDANGTTHAFRVYLASTEARRNQGLMFVKSLAPDRGMLFVFENPRVAGFWMENTLIPLDLLFIAADGRIIHVVENAVPLSRATITSMGVVLGVLELAGGTSAKLGIRPGDRVSYPAFVSR
jgi:uncharacterized protein